jgi:hypothetical protein
VPCNNDCFNSHSRRHSFFFIHISSLIFIHSFYFLLIFSFSSHDMRIFEWKFSDSTFLLELKDVKFENGPHQSACAKIYESGRRGGESLTHKFIISFRIHWPAIVREFVKKIKIKTREGNFAQKSIIKQVSLRKKY